MTSFLEKTAACGIGSFPYSDVNQAVEFVLSSFKDDIIFWPQLPKKSFTEQMLVQFSQGFPGVALDSKKKTIFVDTKKSSFEKEVEGCFQNYLDGNLDYFAVSRDYACGLYALCDKIKASSFKIVKGQIVGPITLGMNLLDSDKQPIIYRSELRECLVKLLAMKAKWQIRKLAGDRGQGTGDRKIIIFIDEPYLSCSGSSFFTLKEEEISAMLGEVIEAVHSEGALCGIHCCGNTDWPLILSSRVDIVSFDACGYLDNLLLYKEELGKFIRRGGILSFGIVPNNEEAQKDGIKDELFRRLKAVKDNLKIDKLLVTSSCGCGTLGVELSQKVNRLSVEIAHELN